MRILVSALCALLMLSAAVAAQDETADTAEPGWNPEPGQVVHLEIPSLNLDESAKFYGDLFGWTSTPAEGDVEYLIWSDGGQTMGGFSLEGAPAKDGGPIIYIFVRSIAEAYKAIEAAGGEPMNMEMAVGEGGYIGMFRDPHGNMLGLFSMQQSMPEPDAAEGEEAMAGEAG